MLVVEIKGESSHAEVLRSMKSDPELEKLKESVTEIRKNADGNLLLELNRKTRERTDLLHGLVK